MLPYNYTAVAIALLLALQAPAAYSADISTRPFHSVMLAEVYLPQEKSSRSFLLSEKYDGIRALWTGKELLTRSGNRINAPQWFTDDLPDFVIDGELWAGYGQFSRIQSLLHQQQPDDHAWDNIQYMVFDMPQERLSFASRYQSLTNWFAMQTPAAHIGLVQHRLVNNQAEINLALEQIISKGGEGVILRDPQRLYINGRDSGMLKYKPFTDDEATVIGYRPGKGKYQSLLGALIVRDRNNRVFAIGSGLSDSLRAQPPQIGTVITYRFQGTTDRGKPRFARFIRVRLTE